ncbi:MAG: pilus assembly protein [Phycisphaerae bacterium]|jgi:Flp pilus assembly protein TadG|nr:pilus assembly protein [Phycisphaerae bacterium]NUQ49411.1 pilus assembly protein [Phycisphaerae bacterium]
MALVMPVLFLMLFGIIEFGWMLSVQNSLVNAAREGARTGALLGYGAEDMQERITEVLTPMGLQDKVSVTLTEATDGNPSVGVELSVQRSQISLLQNFFGFSDGTLQARCWMRKEGM